MVTWPSFSGGPTSSGYYRGTVPLVVGLGDSITGLNNYSDYISGAYIFDCAEGEIAWAYKKWPYFDFTTWVDLADPYGRGWNGANYGVGGDTEMNIKTRLQPVAQQAPDVVISTGGINDINAGRTAAQILADDAAIIDTLIDLGIPVILGTIRPIAVSGAQGWASNSSKRTVLADVNIGRAALIAARDPSVCALWDVYAAYNDGSGYPRAGYTVDGLHPMQFGAHAGGASLVPVLQSFFPASSTPAYPTWTDGGNLYPNSWLAGSGGVVGANCNGVVANTWSMASVGSINSSVNCSLIANPDTGGQSQVFTITPGGANTSERLLFNTAGVSVSSRAGKWVRAYTEIEFSAWDGWRNVMAGCRDLITAGISMNGAATDQLPTSVAGRHVFFTPAIKLPASPANANPVIDIYLNPAVATGTGVLKIHKMWFGEIPNPGFKRNMVA